MKCSGNLRTITIKAVTSNIKIPRQSIAKMVFDGSGTSDEPMVILNAKSSVILNAKPGVILNDKPVVILNDESVVRLNKESNLVIKTKTRVHIRKSIAMNLIFLSHDCRQLFSVKKSFLLEKNFLNLEFFILSDNIESLLVVLICILDLWICLNVSKKGGLYGWVD